MSAVPIYNFIFESKNPLTLSLNDTKEVEKEIRKFLSINPYPKEEDIEQFCRNRNYYFSINNTNVIVNFIK